MRAQVTRRGLSLAAISLGIAIAVALTASLGVFLAGSKASMTARATSQIAVDWQVQVQPGTDLRTATGTVLADRGVTTTLEVHFAQSTGLATTTGTTTQRTGPAVVVGLPAAYRATFPAQIRSLAGAYAGVLLAQQTAANLHARVGDHIQVGRSGLAPATVVVAGIVDLPQADSLFQQVGVSPGTAPSAPPDNIILEPAGLWQSTFAPMAAARPDLLTTQLHTSYTRNLPTDPAAAFAQVAAAARHLEAQLPGGLLVGDNLGATLAAARGDAAYAQVLFLFLGAPGIALAGLLTVAVATASAPRRRREQSLLRARGLATRQLTGLVVAEASAVAGAGIAVGLAVAAALGATLFGSVSFGAGTAATLVWAGACVGVGVLIAAAALAIPAWRDTRTMTVVAGRRDVDPARGPLSLRYGWDGVCLLLSAVVFWASGRNGYQLVLAPEGVTTISVSYWAMAGPALLWAGAGLLTWRLADLLLGRGRRVTAALLRPVAGRLHETVAAAISRQRRPLARAIVLVAVALAFAASTATFNATYRHQAEVDAQLTNGADVTVTESPGVTVTSAAAGPMRQIAGVKSVEPLQHRFAYIGTDLQDLYGVQPRSINTVTALQDAYFTGGTATQLMSTMARQPDSILVSAETVTDFQLTIGNRIQLKLQDGRTHQLRTVWFTYVGVVSEFPTAPKDSFFVANAGYITAQTGDPTVGSFLIDTDQTAAAEVADRIRARVGTSATVTSIDMVRATVGSSLTAVDLAGLTRLELGFAVVLVAAAGGLVLGLGLAERRRGFAIAAALGATRRDLDGFIRADAAVLAAGGLAAGGILGWGLSRMLIAVLTGVFDPPPSSIAVPWPYLGVVALVSVATLYLVSAAAARLAARAPMRVLRQL